MIAPPVAGLAQVLAAEMRGPGRGDPENEHQGIEAELDEDPPGEQLEEPGGAGGEDQVGEGEECEDGLGMGVSELHD